jgi:hypothetical protein
MSCTPQGAAKVTVQPRSTSPLSAQRAFVVQFREDTLVTAGRFAGRVAGRVEHVRSGQAKHFWSLDELLDFIVQMLTAVDTQPPE